jgi:hypothetical protein
MQCLRWVVVLTVIACSAVDTGCGRTLVQYVPIDQEWTRGEPVYVKAPHRLTSEHLIAMQLVLWGYNCPYMVREHRLYIERRLADDQELLYNYIEKADNIPVQSICAYLLHH